MTASVVIAAHNEEKVIGRALRCLLERANPGEFEVVVVCNGCTDRTADVAAAEGVGVVELCEASKTAALNRGDDATAAFPRIYLDADVVLSTEGAREIVKALTHPETVAAAPTLSLDFDGVSWPVRSYFRLWQELPGVAQALSGRGVYAMAAEGRARFDRFPDLAADDYFVDRLFSHSERVIVDVPSIVRPPRTIAATFRRKVRVFAANTELDKDPHLVVALASGSHGGSVARRGDSKDPSRRNTLLPTENPIRSMYPGWMQVVIHSPKRIVDLPAFLALSVLAKIAAAVDLRLGRTGWNRDSTSRNE